MSCPEHVAWQKLAIRTISVGGGKSSYASLLVISKTQYYGKTACQSKVYRSVFCTRNTNEPLVRGIWRVSDSLALGSFHSSTARCPGIDLLLDQSGTMSISERSFQVSDNYQEPMLWRNFNPRPLFYEHLQRRRLFMFGLCQTMWLSFDKQCGKLNGLLACL